jgi:small conductance mechanosensitive channel
MQIDLSAASLRLQSMGQAAVELLPNLVIAGIAFTLFWLLAGLVARGIQSVLKRTGQPQHVALVLARAVRWLVLTLGLMVGTIVVVPSLNASSLLGALGVGSVAVGFAFKDIFQNLLAGMLLLLTRSFSIGDQIVSSGHEGTVEDIQVRATLVRTYDNRLVVIPNSELYTSRVEVNTAKEYRRVEITVGIGMSDDIGFAKEVILGELRGITSILATPEPKVLVRDIGDFSVNLRVYFWVQPPQRAHILAATDAVITAIKPALLAAGIDLPYPTQQVLFHDQTEVTDGDRSRQREGWPAGVKPPSFSRQMARHETPDRT